MSTSIRPPGGTTSGSSGIDASGGPEQASAAPESAGTSASSRLAEAGRAGATAPLAETAQAAESATGRWIQRLESGEVTRSEAVEGLVAEAVERHGGARLSPAIRGELEGVLRSALLGDPVLGRLLGGA